MATATMTFNEAQRDVLGVVSCLHKEEDVKALKKVLMEFLNNRLQDELDDLWDRGLSLRRRWILGRPHISELHINNASEYYKQYHERHSLSY